MSAEFLKLLDDKEKAWITDIFNRIHNSGNIPEKWIQSEFIALLKKAGAKKCDEYRTISLIIHMLKLVFKIIHRKI